MTDCPFCQIAQSQIPTHKVYENDFAFAFMDKHPINTGHVLVIPKTHEANFYQLSNEAYTQLMLAVKIIAVKVNEVTQPHKVGLIVAAWDVPHTHVHIVPMHDYHDITSKSLLEGKRSNPTDDELAQMARQLQ